MTARWRLAGAAVLGAAVAAGQAPLGWWFVALPALAGVIALAAAAHRGAAWIGWAAGAGYAAAALNWIVEPFLIEPEVYGWMAPFALVLMAAGMGLFWAAAAGVGARLGRAPGSRALAMALALAGADLLRGYLFTGFPWALLGHIWIDTPLAQAAAFAGPVGLSLITALVAASLALPGRGRMLTAPVAALALAGLWAGGQARLAVPAPVRAAPVMLRLVQPNAAQHLKWQPDMAREFFYRHLDLTATDPAPGARPPDLVIWPETAVPFLLEDEGPGRAMIAEAAGGVPVAVGIQRMEGARFFNSLALIGAGGAIGPVYDKFHLVPFGEYIPFGDLAARFGITAFAAQAGNGYSAGPGAMVLDLGALGRVQPLICYEAIFPQDLRAAPERPDWLLQITNDGWFGDLTGPWQHLAQARLRAVETGLPLARAANTGVSAVIDAKGRVLAELGMGQIGTLDLALPAALPPTLYARTGDWPVFALIVAALGGLALRQRKAIDRASGRV
ncbi:apolipoprotein N-acyltransferase [Rhodobacter veldkampii DSM 11550]|uniref:Apolipoprotein N-acyltransferase n=1 Tax=Phaeovulum veldkampii DSM 11550 TaxID=1185920 RepID=A0A2T4JM27_9RHOB|nr:apolipoprotein N-acyltransferase [Phaeovulum veldkampii]MBK5946610.1 apolipoprotein N-acyltransferase [Phaeovulum veldkampii DSM 11550]PTE18827.1 apolipoprotein N-acyltransferase [Phaeovulum veldkampii DSM 11550]TDQ59945.1 apolipoprotein N-acyltransferase [Phaeovulum veldkampii DSM 11550]